MKYVIRTAICVYFIVATWSQGLNAKSPAAWSTEIAGVAARLVAPTDLGMNTRKQPSKLGQSQEMA